MRINTRFSAAVHVMVLIALNEDSPATSERMAESVGNHPVAVRQLISMLKKAGLIKTKNGLPGARLAKSQDEITLCEIYQAVQSSENDTLFDLHPNPNPACPVGCNIASALEVPFMQAQKAMENALEEFTLEDITNSIVEKCARKNDSSEKGDDYEDIQNCI